MEKLMNLISALSEVEPITLVAIVAIVGLCVVYLSIKQICKAIEKRDQ